MPRGPRRSTTSPSEAAPDFRRDNPYETRPAAGEPISPSRGQPVTGAIISPSLRDKAGSRRVNQTKPRPTGYRNHHQPESSRQGRPPERKRDPAPLERDFFAGRQCSTGKTARAPRSRSNRPHGFVITIDAGHRNVPPAGPSIQTSPRINPRKPSGPHTRILRGRPQTRDHLHTPGPSVPIAIYLNTPLHTKKSRRQTASGFFIQATPDRSHPPYFAGSTAGAVAVESAGAGST